MSNIGDAREIDGSGVVEGSDRHTHNEHSVGRRPSTCASRLMCLIYNAGGIFWGPSEFLVSGMVNQF